MKPLHEALGLLYNIIKIAVEQTITSLYKSFINKTGCVLHWKYIDNAKY